MKNRKSGIFLHISSLPGDQGIGTLGKCAFNFIDFLKKTSQKLWQICPLVVTGYGNSPYSGLSAFAGNPLLIDIEKLIDMGLLLSNDISYRSNDKINYGEIISYKKIILTKAFNNFTKMKNKDEYYEFCLKNSFWLEDFALYMSLKDKFNQKSWTEWPNEARNKCSDFVKNLKKKNNKKDNIYKFIQYIFFKQWFELKKYANQSGIEIIGDIPIYVSLDSSDCWANPDLFLLNNKLRPILESGVPPDMYSDKGMTWGNPLYNFKNDKKKLFDWWLERFKFNNELFDIIRIDHFRGFAACWGIELGKPALSGRWVTFPGEELLNFSLKKIKNINFIVEDIGIITEDVERLRKKFNFPSMKIMQFGFIEKLEEKYYPENYEENSIVYTSTHDNNTVRGWFKELKEKEKEKIRKYFGNDVNELNLSWKFIEKAWSSKSRWAIAPLQDILNFDESSRMNYPGNPFENWTWRLKEKDLEVKIEKKLSMLTINHKRNMAV